MHSHVLVIIYRSAVRYVRRKNAITTEIASLNEIKIATFYQSRVTRDARRHANLPEEVGRNTVAYGDSRYLQSMPLRTQQYRTFVMHIHVQVN